MKFKNNFIIKKTQINMLQTLECGQIFSYQKTQDGFVVQSGNQVCQVVEHADCYEVQTDDVEYFQNFFDLQTDYQQIKTQLAKHDVMQNPIMFGSGIRILRQNLLEVIISFVISANNNIKRISNTVFLLRQKFGSNIGNFFAFPTLQQLQKITEQDFRDCGAGYRSPQLVKLIAQLAKLDFAAWKNLDTDVLKNRLVELSGIGPKVADCIMLFGYGKTDVFPVDTWIEKVYNQFFEPCVCRKTIRRNLVDKFENLAGYAQQYLFYYQRNFTK